jgi:hypothetical protein
MLNQFFDRAVYYSIPGYDEALGQVEVRNHPDRQGRGSLPRQRDWQ